MKQKIYKDGYVYLGNRPLHRVVVEQFLKRKLRPNEQVHHINEIKNDNRIENLMLFPNKLEHIKFHKKIIQFGFTKEIIGQINNRWQTQEKIK